MVWKRIFRQHESPEPSAPTETPASDERAAPIAPPPIPGARLPGSAAAGGHASLPPHMQRVVQERRRPADSPERTDPRQRLARLRQQRLAILFDVDQGELAEDDDNPWVHRIDLLTEAMDTVTADLAALAEAPPASTWPVPAVPIENLAASASQPFTLDLTIGDEAFTWEETLDWAERGHQISLPELNRTAGRSASVVPATAPAEIRDALTNHLDQSLDAFAEDMRERRLDGRPLPTAPTLADLARPAPMDGGWLDWNGRSPVRAVRAAEELRLRRERDRLLSERGREAEERHRLVERLPIARRRLADVDTAIASTEAAIAHEPGPAPSR